MYTIFRSKRKNKKYTILTPSNKKIHFGAKGMEDYTKHKDNERKARYIARHSAIKKKDGSRAIDDINSPAYWSRWILWNKKTIKSSIKDISKKLNIKINIDI